MALTKDQKVLLVGGTGVAAVAIILLMSGSANAANAATLDPNSARGQAATALAAAIQSAGGYCGSQSSLITAYQTAAGAAGASMAVDGYPGSLTITTLRQDLAAMGTTSSYPIVGTVGLYPWTAAGGWTTGNVPAAFADNSGAAWTNSTGCPGT